MTSLPPTVGLLVSRVRLEEKRIMAALGRRGAEVVILDPRSLSIADTRPWTGPRDILNREIGHVRARYAAAALEALGARVVNTSVATEVSGDKWRTSAALRRHGVPTPATALALTPQAGLDAAAAVGYPCVVKPLVGSWGRLVTLVRDREMAEAVLDHIAALPSPQSHVVYVQKLVPKVDRDIRALVVGGRVVGATGRRSADWRTNVARGAVSERLPVGPDLDKVAVAAAGAVGADIAGVDLLDDGTGGLTVLEVNDRVEFRGLQEAHGDRIDVADAIAAHLLAGVLS